MKKFMFPLLVFAGVSLAGIAIIAIYVLFTFLLPGTANELVMLVCIPLLLSIFWKKFNNKLYIKRDLGFDFKLICAEMLTISVYAILLIFVSRHGSNHAIPAYQWILTGVILVIMNYFFMNKSKRWENNTFLFMTFLFITSMLGNYDTQYIWMISLPFIFVMIIMSPLIESKKDYYSFVISLLIIITCLVLTIVQFSSQIASFSHYIFVEGGSEELGWIAGLLIIAILQFFAIKIRKDILINRKEKAEGIRKEKEKVLQERARAERYAAENRLKEREKRIQENIKSKIESGSDLTWEEFCQCHPDTLDETKSRWSDIVARLNISQLITKSYIKRQIFWDEEVLNKVLRLHQYMYLGSQDDILLKLIVSSFDVLKSFTFLDYYGCNALTKQLRQFSDLEHGWESLKTQQ